MGLTQFRTFRSHTISRVLSPILPTGYAQRSSADCSLRDEHGPDDESFSSCSQRATAQNYETNPSIEREQGRGPNKNCETNPSIERGQTWWGRRFRLPTPKPQQKLRNEPKALSLLHQEPVDNQGIERGRKECAYGIVRRQDDRFAADIKRGIDHSRSARDLVKPPDQFME
jgi:hypothetical protein